MKRNVNGMDLARAMGGIDARWIDLAYDKEEIRKAAEEESAGIRADKTRVGRLYGAEMRKLLGAKVVWVFLAVFLALNTFLAWRAAGMTPEAIYPTDLVARFFDGYFADPDEYEARYREIVAFDAEQSELFFEAMRAGDPDYEPQSLPNRYSDDDTVPDSLLFSLVHQAVDQSEGYPARLEKVTDAARANLDEFRRMGVGENSFSWKYQSEVIRRYEAMRGTVEIGVEYVRGWGGYFDYRLGDVFVFLLLILVSSVVFTQEKQAGFLPVLRVSKRGRGKTALVKILLTLSVTVLFTLLFIGTSFAVFGIRVGYSSPANALQALSKFTYSPYRISIGTYFAVTVAVKLLAFCAFSMLTLLLSNLFRNPVLNYLSGLALFGMNFLFSKIDASRAAAHLNLVSASAVNSLFTRYRAVNLFGAAAGMVPVMLVLFALLIAGGAFTAAMLHVRGGEVVQIGWIDAILSAFLTASAKVRAAIRSGRKRRKRRERTYSLSLFRAEVFKTLVSSRMLALLLLLLVAKGWYSARLYETKPSYGDSVYREYMTQLEGPLTPEKSEWIRSERARIDGVLAGRDAMQEAYRNGSIALEDYREYLTEYGWAEARSELFRTVEAHEAYLAARGSGWFLYDTGWRRLFSGDADLFLYTAVLLLLTGSFAGEYVSRSSAGRFAEILRATKRGRAETFRAKLFSSCMIAVTLALLSFAMDFFFLAKNIALPSPDAPLGSIELFGSYLGGMTVTGYAILFMGLRLLGALFMAMLVCALSELLSRYLPVLGSAVALTLCPALFAAFGWHAAERVSFLSLLAGTPLFLDSARLSLFGSGWSMLALWIAVAGIAVTALLWPARKMFVK
ncbi:MAG: hypothetical protein IK082_00765 [Oscillospiraceae bacterium]|nr:hypothetical protein [Oscillospiraceae bacterium]